MVMLARRVTEIVHPEAELPPFQGIPSDATKVRVLLGGGEVHFDLSLRWVWDRGVAVVPLHGQGGFCSAAWAIGESPTVVLKETRTPAAFWLFDLAHELGHIALGHLNSGGVVDVDNLRPGESHGGDDMQENDANVFALKLLLGEYGSLLEEIRSESRGNYLRFKGAVMTVARKRHVSTGLLGMVAAYELTDIGGTKGPLGIGNEPGSRRGYGPGHRYARVPRSGQFRSAT